MKKFNVLFVLYCLSVFSLVLGQFAVLSRGVDSNVYIFDFVIAVFAGVGLAIFLSRGKFIVPAGHKFLCIFFAVATVSLFKEITTLGESELLVSVAYLFRLGIYFLAGLVCFNMMEQGFVSVEDFLRLLFYAAVFVSVAGFVQLVVLPDFTVLDPVLGWDPHKNRLASTFFDPNFAGGYLSLAVGMALGASLLRKIKLSVIEFVLFVIVPSAAILLTFSRSAWAALAVTLFVLGIFRARKLLLVGICLAFLAYFVVPRVQTRLAGITDPADSASFRLVSWKNSLAIAGDNIALGVGYNAYRYAQHDYGFFDAGEVGGNSGAGSDSSLLFVLATTGIVGLLLFLVGLTTSFIKVQDKEWGIIILAVISGILVQSQFINSIFYPQILFFWPALLGFTSFANKKS